MIEGKIELTNKQLMNLILENYPKFIKKIYNCGIIPSLKELNHIRKLNKHRIDSSKPDIFFHYSFWYIAMCRIRYASIKPNFIIVKYGIGELKFILNFIEEYRNNLILIEENEKEEDFKLDEYLYLIKEYINKEYEKK